VTAALIIVGAIVVVVFAWGVAVMVGAWLE
jgi:hypothetical protein